MDEHDLAILLGDMESDLVERKESASERNKIREAVCAFANDLPDHRKPGVIFVGAKDDGTCANLPITDDLLRTLADMRSDGNITPFPTMTVQKRRLGGCELAVIAVQPSDGPPVRYKGRVCIRVGPRRAYATEEEERRLAEKRRSGDLPFDARPLPSAALSDLDLDLFRREYLPNAVSPEVLADNARSVEAQLTSLRFVTGGVPTVLGVLVAGKDPRQFLPGAYVQFLRIEGTQLTDPIKDQQQIDGPLSDMLRMVHEKLRAHVSVAVDIVGHPTDVRRPDYPMAALQQLAHNAVLHRTYEGTHAPARITWFSDRIEISNPGGPFGQVTRENFGSPGVADYRNPHIAEAMKNLGYAQRFGVGIPIARDELGKNGNPPPEFVVEDTYTLAVMRRRQ